MLLLHPTPVTFAGTPWPSILSAAIDRHAARFTEDWSDLGPHAVHADAPEQRTTITLTQELTRDDLQAPRPGDAGEIVLHTAPTTTDAARKRIAAQAVVRSVEHALTRRGGTRTITLTAISPDGATDPLTITDA